MSTAKSQTACKGRTESHGSVSDRQATQSFRYEALHYVRDQKIFDCSTFYLFFFILFTECPNRTHYALG